MKFKRLVMSAAIAGAVGAGPALSAITGVPGEALLVPLFLNGDDDTNALAETYVALYVPELIGTDTIFDYTKPNSKSGLQNIPGGNFGGPQATIYWKTFDPYSKPLDNDECDISRGDKVIWTTDTSYYQDAQKAQDQAFEAFNNLVPRNECVMGASDTVGYVVFQTREGADGQAAPYAFWGNAWILENALTARAADGLTTNIASVPVIPMADGADGVGAQPALGNEVISTAIGDGSPDTPAAVSPLAAGTRMTGAVGTSLVRMEAELRGPLSGSEQSMHVFWFDQNSEARSNVPVRIWDDQEGSNTCGFDLSKELNILLFNNKTDVRPSQTGFASGGLQNIIDADGYNTTGYVTDVIAAASAKGTIVSAYSAEQYCEPEYWYPGDGTSKYPGSLNGYVRYVFNIEFPTANNPTPTRTAVAFNWQESLENAEAASIPAVEGKSNSTPAIESSAWSSHMTTDLGKY